jgi:DNA-binding Xre family transcriptional regulator
MARADASRSALKTKLARMRVLRDYKQADLEDGSGVGLRTIQRLESGELRNPPLWTLVNLAVALECTLEDIIEDDWLQAQPTEFMRSWPGPDVAGRSAPLCGSHTTGAARHGP